MATVVAGAAIGAWMGAGGIAIGSTTLLAAGMSGIIGGAVLGGALGYTGDKALTPDFPDQPAALPNVQDKTSQQAVKQLNALELGDEAKKRKRKSAKSKFKIAKDAVAEQAGLIFPDKSTQSDLAVAGVQL